MITKQNVFWFISAQKVPQEVKEFIGDLVTIKEYTSLFSTLKEITGKVWIDPTSSNLAIYESIPKENRICDHSPLSIAKAIKNETEKTGLRNCCLRDSAAIIEYFSWLEKELQNGHSLTEFDGSEKLTEFRSKCKNYKGDSFGTISSTGPNAAVIHYHPLKEISSVIDPSQIYLCDSGAQYL